MRNACVFFLFLGSFHVAWADDAARCSNDTIVIDGKLIDVEARVRFDSLIHNAPDRSTDFQASWTCEALMGAGPSSDWWYWSGKPDAAVQITAELLRFPAQRDFRKKRGWQMQLNAGVISAWLVGIDAGTFPDSLIGFLPTNGSRPLRFVTSQQFDIGTETDTLNASTMRTLQVAPFLSAGAERFWGSWSFRAEAGFQYQAQPWPGRPELQAPTLDGPPLVPAVEWPSGIKPRFNGQLGHHFPRSPFHLRVLAVWVPGAPQNLWAGLGVVYDAW